MHCEAYKLSGTSVLRGLQLDTNNRIIIFGKCRTGNRFEMSGVPRGGRGGQLPPLSTDSLIPDSGKSSSPESGGDLVRPPCRPLHQDTSAGLLEGYDMQRTLNIGESIIVC